ncbi:hypothetical protein ACFE04_011191 [Oxalis oulophora]
MGGKVLVVAVVALLCLIGVEGIRSIVGGRTEVVDVKTNKEVQDLGKFAVVEYNKGNIGEGLRFSRVVSAEKQVVSGIKYYLKIEAFKNGEKELFDSVVVVKPWVRNSRALIHFAPATRDR